jgi:hypothetical protein
VLLQRSRVLQAGGEVLRRGEGVLRACGQEGRGEGLLQQQVL